MCLIISVPKGKTFPRESLEAAFYTNEDGLGVMFAAGGRVHVQKNADPNWEDVLTMFNQHRGRQFVMHLRYATHGKEDLENTHPFEVLNKDKHGLDLWMMHNGVISSIPQDDRTKSDTWHFVRRFLTPVLENAPHLIYESKFQDVVGHIIGPSNKLVFLDGSGRIIYVNKNAGSNHESGCWISNTYSINHAKINRSTLIDDAAKARLGVAAATTATASTTATTSYSHDWYNTNRGTYTGSSSSTVRPGYTPRDPVDVPPVRLTKLQLAALKAVDQTYPNQKSSTDFAPMLFANLVDKELVGKYPYQNAERLWVTVKGRASVRFMEMTTGIQPAVDYEEEKAVADWIAARALFSAGTASKQSDKPAPTLATVVSQVIDLGVSKKAGTPGQVVSLDSKRTLTALEEIDTHLRGVAASAGTTTADIQVVACDDMCQLHGKVEYTPLELEDVLTLSKEELLERIRTDPEGVADLLYDEAVSQWADDAADEDGEEHDDSDLHVAMN